MTKIDWHDPEQVRMYNRVAQQRSRKRRPPTNPTKPTPAGWGYVYLFHRDGVYKIGVSVNPERRRGQVSTRQSSATEVHRVYVRRPRMVEMEWKARFKAKRAIFPAEGRSSNFGYTEWFQLSDDDVKWICGQAGDEVLEVKRTMSLEEAVAYLGQVQADVKFFDKRGAPRIRVQLPGWKNYFVEHDTLVDAACAAQERHKTDV